MLPLLAAHRMQAPPMAGSTLIGEAVDWPLAISTATRIAPTGPMLSRQETQSAVAMLRDLALEAVAPVQQVTGLIAPPRSRAQVVDRAAWIESNVAGLQIALAALADNGDEGGLPSWARGVGARGSAVQLGLVLGWLSGKVLGQYEVFTEPGQPGRLLLVAPTIVQVEQQLQVPSRDFRLWVCLHEETHRVQFGAVSWLGTYIASLVNDFIEQSDLGLGESLRRVVAVLGSIARKTSVMEAVQSPRQREVFDKMTGVMSLLEGHADVVMDAVGPQVVPSVALIRERFTARRNSPKAIDALARRALGMDMKLRQYTDGAAFVRQVVDAVGMSGFNKVWASPQALPTRTEITDPDVWIKRMAS